MYPFIWIHVYSLLLPTMHIGILTTSTATVTIIIIIIIHSPFSPSTVSSSPLAYIVTFIILLMTLACHTLQWSCWWSSHVECIAQYWQYAHWNESQKGKWGKIQIIYVCYFFSVASIQDWLHRLSSLCNPELCPPSQNTYKCFIYFFTVL